MVPGGPVVRHVRLAPDPEAKPVVPVFRHQGLVARLAVVLEPTDGVVDVCGGLHVKRLVLVRVVGEVDAQFLLLRPVHLKRR